MALEAVKGILLPDGVVVKSDVEGPEMRQKDSRLPLCVEMRQCSRITRILRVEISALTERDSALNYIAHNSDTLHNHLPII